MARMRISGDSMGAEAAGYVNVIKGFVGKRASTWFSLTALGRREFERYKEALRQIVDE